MRNSRRAAVAVLALGAMCAVATQVRADEKKLGWFDTGELSFVTTSGNNETSSLGVKNTLTHKWEMSQIAFNAGALNARSTALKLTEDPDKTAPKIDEDKTTTTTAEIYYFNGRYDRKISNRFYWYAGAGWDRNKNAGVENRYNGVGGVGNIWLDSDTLKFKSDYAATYTKQKDFEEDPDTDDSFVGVRLSSVFWAKLGEPTTYTNTLIVDDNLKTSQDYRADMTNSLAVAMSKHLALKVGLQWLYDNKPAILKLTKVDDKVFDSVEADKLDSIFTASLVVNF